MAAAYVHENYVNQAPSGASFAFTLTTAVAAGNHLIVCFGTGAATATGISTNASGATAQLDVENGNVGAGSQISICSIYAPNGINNSTDTITLTATAGNVRGIIAEEFSGLTTTNWFDKSATANSTGTALTSGTTAATTSNDEVAVAAWVLAVAGVTFTKDTNYSYFTTSTAGFGTTARVSFAEYQILSATGTQAATATAGSSQIWFGAIATYQAAAVTPPAPTVVDTAVARAANY